MMINSISRQFAILAMLSTSMVYAEPVEIALSDTLDGYLANYCLTINSAPANPLQLQTCDSYRGALSRGQTFETTEFEYNLLYVPAFDVCAEVAHLTVGAKVGLATCNSTAEQQFVFSANGTISPTVEPTLCLTASLTTRLAKNKASKVQIKGLTLALCSVDLARFQHWRTGSK